MTFGRMRNSSEESKNAHPNLIVYRRMEAVINQMLSAEDGVPIKTVKSFLSKIPSVFTGQDIIAWILKHIEVSDLSKAENSKRGICIPLPVAYTDSRDGLGGEP